MDQSKKRVVQLQPDWYSPRRLHDSPTQYEFPGDRFIPNRSLMNLDQAHCLLTNKIKEIHNPNFGKGYREMLRESLTLDSEGRPFRMLVFRGSPKSRRKWNYVIDEMRRDIDAEVLSNGIKQHESRHLPTKEVKVLDAPKIKDDYYVNLMDWGKNNVLAVALGSALYLWNAENQEVKKLLEVQGHNDYPTSVAWSEKATSLAIGCMKSKLQIWDPETSKCIRSLGGHQSRIAAIAWNGHTLTTGSRDRSIINHDVRVRNSPTSRIQAHTEEVCGLKWSSEGNVLASGGNESFIYIWEASKMSSSNFLHRFNAHNQAAVKALAWCPYQFNVLASGGGTGDGCIKIWNMKGGTCTHSIETKAQICGLEWNRHHKEILSGHGYGNSEVQNHLCLWKYPSMTKVGEINRHERRVISLSQSPDGLTVVSAGGDETLRFWEIFGPPRVGNSASDFENLLSFKTSLVR
ncbi:PREDICTED: cell division cycle 20.5, cofactor of APC complex-like [Populus euphratica]|uniref:Cell division cycle 20.5, cofactor of APC complex-like n=1 Tax=Populus euphratica TaxID=75702 RepID=A0AAJ6Y2W9_POPEU|nr:PREDICTED: cell division cycle 20.5, cofactor of APC complex-like [Populus euphratica]